ncbi:UNVERIFIED_CONTAM: hypothetical protein PYX00_006307 [Menopon gallinae]|uniref:Uncharacterized protein n=1 Tax=Menopon gallinae TaxID=328185 RepID=A0AAW2HUP6_9NEOP
MSFSAIPVYLAFILNRFSIRFFTSCRCILGFTPFSASLTFGLSLVAILIKHPQLYPCWLRRVNAQIMFLYELFTSIIFIEIGFCLWNSLETLIFYKMPLFLEEHCISFGEYYIYIVESPIGVSLLSNILALALLLITLHSTKVCDFNLLRQKNGIHKFFADAGLTSKVCRHHKDVRNCCATESDSSISTPVCTTDTKEHTTGSLFSPPPPPIVPTCDRPISPMSCSHSPKMLRSGKKIYSN